MATAKIQIEYLELSKKLFHDSLEEGFHLSVVPKKWLSASRALYAFKRGIEEEAKAFQIAQRKSQLAAMAEELKRRLAETNGLQVLSYRQEKVLAAVVDVDFNPQFELHGQHSYPEPLECYVWVYLHPFAGMTLIDLERMVERSSTLHDRDYRDDVMSDYFAWKRSNKLEFFDKLKKWRGDFAKDNAIKNLESLPVDENIFYNDVKATLLAISGLREHYSAIRTHLIGDEGICYIRGAERFLSVSTALRGSVRCWVICSYALDREMICELHEVFECPIKRHADDMELGTGLVAFIASFLGIRRPYWRNEPDCSRINTDEEISQLHPDMARLIGVLMKFGFTPIAKAAEKNYLSSRGDEAIHFADHGLRDLSVSMFESNFCLYEHQVGGGNAYYFIGPSRR